MCNLTKEATGQSGTGIAEEVSFPLGKVESLVSKYDSTPASFISLLICLAMDIYNKKPSYVENIMENRSPNENIAGMRFTTGAIGLTTTGRTLTDLFADINEQMVETLKYTYYNFEGQFERGNDSRSLGISYVADWFGSGSKSFGKELPLENQNINGDSEPAPLVLVRHEDGQMVFKFQYDRKNLSDEHANEFATLLKNIGGELLNEKVPAEIAHRA
jgi:hypothetical protein